MSVTHKLSSYVAHELSYIMVSVNLKEEAMKRTEMLQEVRKMRFEEHLWGLDRKTSYTGRCSKGAWGMFPNV